MKINVQNIEIEVSKGDISNQPGLDVLVNAANSQLAPGGGVAGAIHKAAGSGLYEECKALAPIQPGQAVITKAYHLPNSFVIHCLGPVYGKDAPESDLLASCYRNSLRLADENELNSIAFPAISTGIFGYPSQLAVVTVFNTVLAELPRLKHLKKIKFVLFSEKDFLLYENKWSDLKAE